MNGTIYFPQEFANVPTPVIPWNKPENRMKDGKMITGRPAQGYGDDPFTYANKTLVPLPWIENEEILLIRNILEDMLGVEFYYCLCGLYTDNTVGIPYHSDEIENDEDLIVSVSFGATRPFYVKSLRTGEEKAYYLAHGDLVVMTGASQRTHEHAVPPVQQECGERVNLTFRTRGI